MNKKFALYVMFFFGMLLLFANANTAYAEEMKVVGGQGPGGTTSTGKMVTTYDIPVDQSVLEEPVILPAPGQPIGHDTSDKVPTDVPSGDSNPDIEQDVPVSQQGIPQVDASEPVDDVTHRDGSVVVIGVGNEEDSSSISLLGKLFLDVSGLFQGLFLWMG